MFALASTAIQNHLEGLALPGVAGSAARAIWPLRSENRQIPTSPSSEAHRHNMRPVRDRRRKALLRLVQAASGSGRSRTPWARPLGRFAEHPVAKRAAAAAGGF